MDSTNESLDVFHMIIILLSKSEQKTFHSPRSFNPLKLGNNKGNIYLNKLEDLSRRFKYA